ncbi:hypothetical protein T459_13062 [Capsicum annuum]|uniref:Uncharacterized protein n=1 Tax=Capsicum annuum TaxID=4072 RepID=A0A2G2ZRK3_CAPAN|nr:hypothetical protein T459_13062 [Capsicum annuum]
MIDEKVIVKLGPKTDLGSLIPSDYQSKYTRGVLQRANMEGEKPIWTPMVGGLQFFKTGSESFNDPALYRSLAGLEACIFQALKGTMTSGLHRQHSC